MITCEQLAADVATFREAHCFKSGKVGLDATVSMAFDTKAASKRSPFYYFIMKYMNDLAKSRNHNPYKNTQSMLP